MILSGLDCLEPNKTFLPKSSISLSVSACVGVRALRSRHIFIYYQC